MYRHFVFLLSLIFLFCQGFSQPADTESTIQKAHKNFKSGDYADALTLYLQLASTLDSTHSEWALINYRIGFLYYSSEPDNPIAIPYLYNYLSQNDTLFESWYFLANIYEFNLNFDSAAYCYEKFKELLPKYLHAPEILIEQIVEIIDKDIAKSKIAKMFVNNPNGAKITSLGGGVNTVFSEYGPVISPDETKFVFTRRSQETLGGRMDKESGDFFEDIFFSAIEKPIPSEPVSTATDVALVPDAGGTADSIPRDSLVPDSGAAAVPATFVVVPDPEWNFTFPLNAGQNLNTEGHEGAIQFSADGYKLFLYRKSNIWVSDYKIKKAKWKKAKKLKKFKGVLRPKTYEPSFCFSSDGNSIYFSSERPGGFGGLDIYRSDKATDGKWSLPYNLGSNINSEYDEDSPFITSDGGTLYFSSKGHTSIGGHDVFMSRQSGNEWTKPVNMGVPINSPGDDVFFTLSSLSNTGFHSSNRSGGKGLMDIYKVELPADASSKATLTGKVLTKDTLPAYVKLTITSDDGSEPVSVQSDSLKGTFNANLSFDKTYNVIVEEEAYEKYDTMVKFPPLLYYAQKYKHDVSVVLSDKEGYKSGKKILKDTLLTDSLSTDSVIKNALALAAAKQDSINNNKAKEKQKKQSASSEGGATYGSSVFDDPPGQIIYRVQIGAYRNEPSAEANKEIPELAKAKFDDGFIRAFSGKFTTKDDALKRKEEMIAIGREGAFIVPFKDGKRMAASGLGSSGISSSEVTPRAVTQKPHQVQSPKSQTESPKTKSPEKIKSDLLPGSLPMSYGNYKGSGSGASKPTETSNPNRPKFDNRKRSDDASGPKQKKKLSAAEKLGIKFKVQVGVYKTEAPAEVTNKFKKYGNIIKDSTAEGLIRYLSGVFTDYPSAEKHRFKLMKEGIGNATIVAKYKGKYIFPQEAIELMKQVED